ncbi:MAG: four helix bundle protein [Prevotella sp.]|jgi:four helix bundle protein|nr:four helix bundle protein [Prevotella sp.]
MKYNILHDKTLNFAVRIVKLYKYLIKTQKEFDLPRQILRSGTSIGANSMESRSAQSTADFINKLQIALKEADETSYWLQLFLKIDYINQEQFDSLDSELQEIIKILVSIIKKTKESAGSLNS